MTKRAPEPLPRWRHHCRGMFSALVILALTMAVLIGPGTAVGQRISHHLDVWIAYIAPLDDSAADLNTAALVASRAPLLYQR